MKLGNKKTILCRRRQKTRNVFHWCCSGKLSWSLDCSGIKYLSNNDRGLWTDCIFPRTIYTWYNYLYNQRIKVVFYCYHMLRPYLLPIFKFGSTVAIHFAICPMFALKRQINVALFRFDTDESAESIVMKWKFWTYDSVNILKVHNDGNKFGLHNEKFWHKRKMSVFAININKVLFFKLRFIIEKRICKHVLTVATKLIYVLLHSVKIDLLRANLGLSCLNDIFDVKRWRILILLEFDNCLGKISVRHQCISL